MSSRKEKSRYPKSWSKDWIEDKKQGVWYKEREVAKDKYQLVYYDEDYKAIMDAPPPSTLFDDGETAPENYTLDRTQETIDQITNGIHNTSIETTDFQPNIPDLEVITGRLKTRRPGKPEEKFDKNYRQHWQAEFKYGRVFKVLWSEPKGSGNEGGTLDSYRGKHHEHHEKVRSFVIIDPRPVHCLCLPIMSYGSKGTAKKGVHKDDNAIIHTTSQPAYVSGETPLKRTLIKVKPYTPEHKLDKVSRLNYTKVYTVEYNVKVWFIGEIVRDWEWWLTADYNAVHPLLSFRNLSPPAGLNAYTTPRTSTPGPSQQNEHAGENDNVSYPSPQAGASVQTQNTPVQQESYQYYQQPHQQPQNLQYQYSPNDPLYEEDPDIYDA